MQTGQHLHTKGRDRIDPARLPLRQEKTIRRQAAAAPRRHAEKRSAARLRAALTYVRKKREAAAMVP
jgi:hypothetical protein